MRKFLLFLTALSLMTGSVLAQTSELFICEYIEGNGNNKAIELYNGTSNAVDLSEYTLSIFANGSTSAGQIIAFDSVNLPSGETFVLVNSFAAAELLAHADQTSNDLTFNGDDAVVLEHSDFVIDSIGTVGVDPGYSWSCDDGNTQNQTLRRNVDVCVGDMTPDDPFDVCLEWTFFTVDTFDGLHDHSNECGSVGNGLRMWGALKANYR